MTILLLNQVELVVSCEERRNGEGPESLRGSSEIGEAFTEGHEGLLCQIRSRELRQLP